MEQISNLQELFSKFRDECEYITCLKPITLKNYEYTFRIFRTVMPEVISPDNLSELTFIEFFKRLETRERKAGSKIKTGVTSSTVYTYWGCLNRFCNWLKQHNHIKESPFSRLKPPKVFIERSDSLTEEDLAKLYSAASLYSKNTFVLRRNTVMISLLLFCGLRLGEFIDLELTDVDMPKKILRVRAVTSKTQKIRFIPIHPTLLMHLNDYLKERKALQYQASKLIVSANSDRGLSRIGLKHWTNNLIAKSGVKFHLHQFRHTFACRLAMRNINAAKIQMLLGHSSLDMTMTYLRSMKAEALHDDINDLKFW